MTVELPGPLKPTRISFGIFAVAMVLVCVLHLTTPLMAVLFSYLVLNKLRFAKQKWLAVVIFILLVVGAFSGFVYSLKLAFVALPEIVSTSIPIVVRFANQHGIDLPFADVESLRALALESVRETLGYLGNFAKIATKEFAFLIIGIVVAIGIFWNPTLNWDNEEDGTPSNLYSLHCQQICQRFGSFYSSFEKVMGAQVVISAINTFCTALFVYSCSFRHATVLVILTFICGLLPVVGNLVSNSMIVGIAFTVSPRMAASALVFLVVIHKLEYFLNSRIIGSRIRHPMWLMLLALVVGERLMGIGGIILAPVLLHLVKFEMTKMKLAPAQAKPRGSSTIFMDTPEVLTAEFAQHESEDFEPHTLEK